MRSHSGKDFEMIGVLVVVAIFAMAILFRPISKITGIPFHYSDGERTGVVVKISKKGIIWKTWEGQMNLGSMSTDGSGVAVPSIFLFSVKDDDVVKQIQSASKDGRLITLYYEQPLVQSYSDGESGYLVTGTDSKGTQ